MLDELVGQAHADDVRLVSIVGHKLEHSATESALDGTILQRDDVLELAAYLV